MRRAGGRGWPPVHYNTTTGKQENDKRKKNTDILYVPKMHGSLGASQKKQADTVSAVQNAIVGQKIMPTMYKNNRKKKTTLTIPAPRTGPRESCIIRDMLPGGYMEVTLDPGESKPQIRGQITSAAKYRGWKVKTRSDDKNPDVLKIWRIDTGGKW